MWVHEGVEAGREERSLHPSGLALFRFWETARGQRSAPCRNDLDLKQIRRLVPALFILEQSHAGQGFNWRLAGTAIRGLLAREVTGTELLDGWGQAEGAVIRRTLATVIAAHQPALFRLRLTTGRGQTIMADMAAFPLIAADGRSTHVFGGLFAFDDPALKEYDAITGFELVATRFAPSETMAMLGTEAPAQARRKFRVITGGLDRD